MLDQIFCCPKNIKVIDSNQDIPITVPIMCFKQYLVLCFIIKMAASSNEGFIFNGFSLGLNTSLELSCVAEVNADGLCSLTNGESFVIGHAFYPHPIRFKNSTDAKASSFSTTFVFVMVPENSRGHGMAFVLAPHKDFISGPEVSSAQHLGLFNITNDGNPYNHIVAIELDTFKNLKLGDPNDNHVGIDINGLRSSSSASARYVIGSNQLSVIDLASEGRGQLWAEYDSTKHQLNVTLSPFNISWSFQIDGMAKDLDLTKLPYIPTPSMDESREKEIALAVPVGLSLALEVRFGLHRFAYKDLALATKGFNEKELLGQGGFGQVFKGELPVSKDQIAVKRISHKSNQGMTEFLREIYTTGTLRHPNLVPLLGLLSRFSIIKDMASVVAYLDEGPAGAIIHRDIKASNVILDSEFNGRLSDFGFARCSKLAWDPQYSPVAGTSGYMAQELARTRKANTSTDVYAFGAF
ncbi:putative Concanavalin A-like lectin protein kinase family protein [Hibiscus syriacus]|uniref:Concanavalin A-like lectin protein kinase family protein n=1 Tax=Hibiscus syriacus TaxID=106335 RepID=A0A6A2ZXA2_HIBSY|nr:putative Concanavalin A-like lectin protein kinase family protein [Hibiscus syriacus]